MRFLAALVFFTIGFVAGVAHATWEARASFVAPGTAARVGSNFRAALQAGYDAVDYATARRSQERRP